MSIIDETNEIQRIAFAEVIVTNKVYERQPTSVLIDVDWVSRTNLHLLLRNT